MCCSYRNEVRKIAKEKQPNIIKQHDKRSGQTYLYESISYWDAEKKNREPNEN